MKQAFLLLSAIFIIVLAYSCKEPEPPTETFGAFTTGVFGYNCLSGSPLRLASGVDGNNGSRVTAQTTSIAAPQYDSGLQLYANNNISTNPFTNGCANVAVPISGEYTAVVRFIEGNDICNGGNPSLCFRWFTMQTSPSGFVPNCGNFALFINDLDPSGFIGPCL